MELLGAGNPDNRRVVWATPAGPSGTLGGIEWGSAVDRQRVYVAIANNSHQTYRLGRPNGPLHNAGSWAARDTATGQILWQPKVTGQDPRDPQFGAMGLDAVSAANGVMYAGSMSGHMVALDGATGAVLKSFLSAGSVICDPAIVRGTVYWGSGYGRAGGASNTSGPRLFAFSLRD